jgi:hypothetical protein
MVLGCAVHRLVTTVTELSQFYTYNIVCGLSRVNVYQIFFLPTPHVPVCQGVYCQLSDGLVTNTIAALAVFGYEMFHHVFHCAYYVRRRGSILSFES